MLEVDDTEHEIWLLLVGRVRLTDQYGDVDSYGMGFVTPMGPKDTWENLMPVRKRYVIWQPT